MTTNADKLRKGGQPPGTEVVPRSAYEGLKLAIEKNEQAFARALTGHAMAVDGFKQAVLNMAIANPAILDCDAKSIIGAALICASTGLHPGPEGYAHIVPYNEKDQRTGSWVKKAQFQYGFKGLLKLAFESGLITNALVEAVFEGDDFLYQLGTSPGIHHIPKLVVPHDEEHLTHVYAILFHKDGPPDMRVMTKDDVDRVRRGSKGAFGRNGEPKTNSPWFQHYVEMARKTVLRNLMKTVYLGDRFAGVLDQDDKTVEWTPKVAERTGGNVLIAPDATNWDSDETEAPAEPATPAEEAPDAPATEDAAPEPEDAEIVEDEPDPIEVLKAKAEETLDALEEEELPGRGSKKAEAAKKKAAAKKAPPADSTKASKEASKLSEAPPSVPEGEAITEAMMRGLNMTLKNMDVPDETLREWLAELGKTSRKELSKTEAIALIKRAGSYRRKD